jgi:hypothetical protein
MNFNAIIAVLVLRNIITEDEATQLVEHLNDKPQSTVLRDSIAQIAEIIGKPANTALMPQLGPVGPAQHAEEMAARANAPVAPVAPPPTPLEPANTQGPENVTGPDQSGNEASLEHDDTSHDLKSETAQNLEERHDKNERPASDDKPASNDNTNSTSVNKPKSDSKKK